MDALILSCGTGGGHDSAARAVAEEMEHRGHRAVLLNPYTLKSDRLASTINNVYIGIVKRTPALFGAIYSVGEMYRRLPWRSPVYFINAAMAEVLCEYIRQNRFDAVLTTHLFPAETLTQMKARGMEAPPSIFISTDYACIPFVEETALDAYITPTPELNGEYLLRGIPQEKLYPFGIPTSRVFAQERERAALKRELGLDEDKDYLLLSGGSMGAGRIERTISILQSELPKDGSLRLIVVCGSHARLYEHLKAKYGEQMTILGHTDEMAAYMRLCRGCFTKPGGLSTTEAAVSGAPLIHIAPIPGCETKNARYFSSHGMSLSTGAGKKELLGALRFLQDEDALRAMRQAQRNAIHGDAAARICALAEDMARQRLRQDPEGMKAAAGR